MKRKKYSQSKFTGGDAIKGVIGVPNEETAAETQDKIELQASSGKGGHKAENIK